MRPWLMWHRTNRLECKCDQSLAKPFLNVRAKFMLAHQMMTLKTKTCTRYQQMTRYLGGVMYCICLPSFWSLRERVPWWRRVFLVAMCHWRGKYGKYSDGHKHRQLKHVGLEWEGFNELNDPPNVTRDLQTSANLWKYIDYL